MGVIRDTVRALSVIQDSSSEGAAAHAALDVARTLGCHQLNVVDAQVRDGNIARKLRFSSAPDHVVAAYEQSGIIEQDPLIHRVLGHDAPVLASVVASQRLTPVEREVLDHLRGLLDCNDALVIPIPGQNGETGIVSFGGPNPDVRPHAKAVLMTLGHCVYGQLEALAQYRPKSSIAVANVLTGRERECLEWVSQGKCDSDIAIILGISERTARFHVANAKRKLNAPSRVQAVTAAIAAKMIGT